MEFNDSDDITDIDNMMIKKERKRREPGKIVIINEEELIRQVEMRPILYDKSLKGYRKSSLRGQSWLEIATILGSTVEECRKRWRSLRDAFSKHFKHYDPDTSSKRKKWLFFDQMYFISQYLDFPTSGEINGTKYLLETEDDSNNMVENSHETILLEENISEQIEELEEVNYKPVVTADAMQQAIEEHSHSLQNEQHGEEQSIDLYDQNQVIERIFESPNSGYQQGNNIATATTSNDSCGASNKLQQHNTTLLASDSRVEDFTTFTTTDPDERFLLSCSPILKRLSNKKNALARLRIQQILYSIEFGS